MALHWRPVGPLPAATYWTRRGLLLVATVVVLLLLRSCGGAEPGADSVTSDPTPTPTTSASATPSASASAQAAAPIACLDSQLQTTVAASPTTSPTAFVVTVQNRGDRPCRRDLGPGVLDLVVTSGEDRVWARSDCDRRTVRELATLAAGGSRAVRVPWDGRRSLPECGGRRAETTAGTYRVAGKVGSKPVAPVVFRVR